MSLVEARTIEGSFQSGWNPLSLLIGLPSSGIYYVEMGTPAMSHAEKLGAAAKLLYLP